MARKKKSDPIADLWNKVPPYLRNRYFLALVAFTFFMVFIDRHDIATQFRLHSTVNRLEESLQGYDELIDNAEAEKMDMEANRETFAREGYFMQKDDEDVFIIVEEEEE
ncbi:hypothetical protein [Neolewinella persica]|uniref:hypothetical protein n=1 Tax=Neolewinella persica TaxID=70998 RepID=UPI00035FC0A1|nr:hypothetical protein [Neolewinella persica]